MLTMIFDVHWINNFILGIQEDIITKDSLKNNFSRFGRALKLGSRAIRVLRFLRLTRLSRISKLYKIKQKLDENFTKKRQSLNINNNYNRNIFYNDNRSNSNNFNHFSNTINKNYRNSIIINNGSTNNNLINQNSETKVAQKLSDLILTRVILMILFMIFGIILFDPAFYFKAESSMEYGLKIFNEFADYNSPIVNMTFNIYVNEHLVIIVKFFRL